VKAETSAIGKLLGLARAPDNSITRAALGHKLDDALALFKALTEAQKPIPREDYEKVETAARKLTSAMRTLDRHWRPRGGHWLSAADKAAADQLLPRIAEVAQQGAQPRRRSRPRRDEVLAVLDRAALFYAKYSSQPVSSYEDGHFAKFLRQFFEAVTGSAPTTDLERQIRIEVKRTKARAALSGF
jgi:hypothetical protein